MVKSKGKKANAVGRPRNNDENLIRTYLREVNGIPLLKREEEEKIALLAMQGDKAARERLVRSNLRFVIMMAKKFQGQGLPLEDLIAEGNIGLLNSIEHFDVNKGYRFITYAVWWIRQAIIKALHEKGRMIRLPSNKTNELMKIEKTRKAICEGAGQKGKNEIHEIASFLDMPQKKADNLMMISQDVLSLDDSTSSNDDSLAIKDYVEDDNSKSPVEYAINSALRDDLEKILSGLGERAAEVIRCRYGLGNTYPMTLKEIGTRYKLSRERVRQIEKRAILQLQSCSRVHNKLEVYIA